MSITALIYFFMFSIVIIGMYVSIRREWMNPGIVTAIGVIGSTVTMMLMLKEMNNNVGNFQAVFFGFLIGGVFSVTALAVAWYFHSNEIRQEYANQSLDEG